MMPAGREGELLAFGGQRESVQPLPSRTDDESALPQHARDSVQSIVELKSQHARGATRGDRFAERLVSALGRPAFLASVLVFVATWIVGNLAAPAWHLKVFDAPPFYWLQGAVSLTALCLTILVLSTQRRLDRLAEERAQLTLQVALVNEQKIAKVIALLEELRSDHPEIVDRHDAQAAAMAEPTNPQSVLDALRESTDEVFSENLPAS